MKAYWVFANLDGDGRKWCLALDYGRELYFPEYDFAEEMSIGTYAAEFEHVRVIPILPPEEPPSDQ